MFYTVVDDGRFRLTQPTPVEELWKSAMKGAFGTYRLPQNVVEVHAAAMRVHFMATRGQGFDQHELIFQNPWPAGCQPNPESFGMKPAELGAPAGGSRCRWGASRR